MKHDFEAWKGHEDPLDWPKSESDSTDIVIQRLSRLAGPAALIVGYLATYALWRYFFT
ncbi:hypothetical protein [Sphingobium sp. BS19]|jgi:hypothetical protein|uniref:hypothetical protein n=1 Tax=Sphingobium sp. BS19 TaxID=3018973 RepID=UPI001EF9BDBB|nr:hypothetical protein [Sphingobium sp. BS19]CAH0353809.1 hypothetical protein SPH9361_02664 [Sphingobium sp. CECT 9361]|tara:strand:+ start:446 stop:619 length:174 start_codon:yes stop_codon:yes gene_type:complete